MAERVGAGSTGAQARKDKTELQLKNERILILEAELAKLKNKLEEMENE